MDDMRVMLAVRYVAMDCMDCVEPVKEESMVDDGAAKSRLMTHCGGQTIVDHIMCKTLVWAENPYSLTT